MRQFFAWTDQAKLYPNIAENIKGARISEGYKKDYLPAIAIKTVLNNICRLDVIGKRDFALLSLMSKCGLRICEIRRSNIEDLRAGRLYIQGKGKDEKSEFVKIPHLLEMALREYLAAIKRERKEGMPLFVCLSNRNKREEGRMTKRSISRIVKRRLKEAGYNSERLTAHSLRHSAITLSLLNGATIQEAQQLARHSNINTTMIYSHNITAEKNPCVDLVEQAIGI